MKKNEQIALAVFGIHFFLLFTALTLHFLSPAPPHQPIQVRVVREVAKAPTITPSPPAASPSLPKKKPLPAKTSSTKPRKKSTPKASPSPPPAAATTLLQLTEEIETPLQQTPSSPPIVLPSLSLPSPKELELPYEEMLSTFLHRVLVLPEKGEVQALVEIDKNGKLVSLHVTLAKSERNQHFLEEKLPALSFPPPSKKQKVAIAFKNQE